MSSVLMLIMIVYVVFSVKKGACIVSLSTFPASVPCLSVTDQ